MIGCRLWAVLVTALVLSLSGPGGVRAQDYTVPGAYTVILAEVEAIVDGTVMLKVSGDDLPSIADVAKLGTHVAPIPGRTPAAGWLVERVQDPSVWLRPFGDVGDAEAGETAIIYSRTPRTAEDYQLNGKLVRAARIGDIDGVEAALARGADIDMVGNYGVNALAAAAYYGHSEIVALLIAAGANLEQRGFAGYGAIHEAASEGHVAIVEALIAAGLSPDFPASSPLDTAILIDTSTALHFAARSNHAEVVRRLIHLGAAVDPANKRGDSPLSRAAETNSLQAVRALLALGADPNFKGRDDITPLHLAVRKGHSDVIAALLAAGADPNARLASGSSPLDIAVVDDREEAAGLLLTFGADPNQPNPQGQTAAEFAESRGRHDAASILADPDALAEAIQWQAKVLLGRALSEGRDVQLADYLAAGLSPDTVVDDGDPALLAAVRAGRTAAAELLIAAGADPDRRGRDGRFALAEAIMRGDDNIARRLLLAGADRNAQLAEGDRDAPGATPLALAVKAGDRALAETLVSLGADPKIADASGRRPADHAAAAGLAALADRLTPTREPEIDPVAESNKLIVGALRAARLAEAAAGTEKASLLQSALADLTRVMDDYPETDVAVTIATNGAIGSYRFDDLRRAHAAAVDAGCGADQTCRKSFNYEGGDTGGSGKGTIDFDIFWPIERQDGDRVAVWAEVLRDVPGLDDDTKLALVGDIAGYESDPSARTALKALRHFETFAGNKDLRKAAFGQNLALFQTLDALKYDLILQANKRVNADRAGQPGIAYFMRVGSSGQRSLDWVNWRLGIDWRTGDPADRVAPHDLSDMPDRDRYVANKLLAADDDVTNRAHPDDERTVPGINELINREATRKFAEITAELLGTPLEPSDLMVEYLSPTQAYGVLQTTEPDNVVDAVPDYLEALVRAEPEKYNGLFTEEQLHAWAVEKGVVTEMRVLDAEGGADPSAVDDYLAATKPYAGSAAARAHGEQLFPRGIEDLAGWMANNYRQIFIVHEATPKDIAKYTLRMLSYWSTFGLDVVADLADHGHPLPAKYASAEGFKALDAKLRALYTPDSPQAYDEALQELGGSRARGTLTDINRRVLLGGHRKHVSLLTERLRSALSAHGAARANDPTTPPPSLSDLIGSVTDFRKNPLLMSLDTLAGAYGNLPDEVVETLTADLGEEFESLVDTEGKAYDVEVRKYLMLALQEVRRGAAQSRGQSAGFATIRQLRARFDGQIEEHLKQIGGLDLDAEIIRLATGNMTRQRLRVVWDGRIPSVRWVEEQWKPADVAQDLDWTHRLMRELTWPEDAVAGRLAQAFMGDPPLAVDALRQLYRLFDVRDMEVRYVSYTDTDGNTVRKAIHPTRFVDPAMNLGVIMFKAGIMGGTAFQNAWGIWGDISEASKLVQTIADMTVRSGLSEEDQRKALANAMASSISLVDRGVGLLNYAGFLANQATTPALVTAFGESLTTFATLSGTDTTSEEMALQLLQAGFKDLSLIVYPQLAPAYFLYGVYSWGTATLSSIAVNNDVVQLLVENGEWEVPDDRKGLPKLTGLKLGPGEAARVVRNEGGGAPVTQCLDPTGTQDLIKPSVLQWISQRRPDDAFAGGIPLASGPNAGVRVKPREALIDLLHAQGYPDKDPVLSATRYAIEQLPGSWTAQLFLMRWQTAKTWDAEWLRRLGIVVPTQDDARRHVEGKIQLAPRSQTDATNWRGFLDDAQDGVRKNFGFLVSQYWVQRQILMEGPILCALFKTAARQAMAHEMEGIEADFLDELAKLEQRLHELDRRVWPEIARSADPIEGPNYDPDKHTPIADDFQRTTARHREILRRIEAELGLTAQSDTRSPQREDVPDLAPPDTEPNEFVLEPPPSDSVGPSAVTAAPADVLDKDALQDLGGQILAGLTNLTFRYEDDYGEALKTLASLRKRVKSEGGLDSAADLDIHPYHVDLMGRGFLSELDQELPPPDGSMWTEAVAFAEAGVRLVSWLYNLPRPGDVAVRSTRDLDDAYGTARNQATDDVAEQVERLLGLMAPETSTRRAVASDADPVLALFNRVLGEDPREIARRHPYYASLVRLRNQIAKLDHLGRTAAEAETEEIATALKTMWRDWDSDNGGGASGDVEAGTEEAATETGEAPAGEGTSAAGAGAADGGESRPDIAGLKAAMEAEYERRRALVGGMFALEMELDPSEDLAVSDHLRARGKTSALTRLRGPQGAQIDELVTGYWWQLWPTGTGEPGEPECTYPMEGRFEHAIMTKGRTMTLPLRQVGSYRLKVGAIGHNDVPLAAVKRPVDIAIAPAELAGVVRFEGDWPGQNISLFFGPEGIEPPRARAQIRARDVGPDGAFIKPLCVFHSTEMPPPANDNAEAAAAATGTDGAVGATGVEPTLKPFWAYAGVQTGSVLDPRSPPVGVRFKHRAPHDENAGSPAERAHFRLTEPLRMLSADVRLVSVTVTDASGTEIDAEVTVDFRGGTLEGAGPHELRLEPGDRVRASASLDTDAGPVSAKSDVLTFDPDVMEGELVLRVELPAFATGNLRLAGTLVLPEDAERPVALADGRIWSNIAPDLSVGGEVAFELANDRPVRLADGLALSGLFNADDGRFLRIAGGETSVELEQGTGRYEVDIALEIHEVHVEPVLVRVTDLSGNELPVERTEVAFDDEPARLDGDVFSGSVVLTHREDAVAIRATFELPGGEKISQERPFTTADVNDLLDPAPPADPIEIRLPLHAGGQLRLAGTALIETDGAPTPSAVTLEVTTVGDPTVVAFEAEPGTPFAFALPDPLRVGTRLTVRAEAEADGRHYRAAIEGITVAEGPIVELGDIVLSAEPDLVTIPDLRGETVAAAMGVLEPLGLELAVAEERPEPGEPAEQDRIFEQDRVGETVRRGETVRVEAYADIELIAVPDVVGEPIESAKQMLSGSGFDVVDRPVDPDDYAGEAGTVVGQIPSGWARAEAEILVAYLPSQADEPEGAGVDFNLATSWRGTLQLEQIALNGRRMPGSRFKSFIIDHLAKELEKEAEERRRREEAAREEGASGLGALAEIPDAVGEGIAEGLGQALSLALAIYGGSVAELLSDGVDVGFTLIEDPDAPDVYRVRVEGFSADAQGDKDDLVGKMIDGMAKQAQAWDPALARDEPGGPFVAREELADDADGSIRISLTPDSQSGTVTLEFAISAVNTEPSDDTLRSLDARVRGTLTPAPAMTYGELRAGIMQRLPAIIARVSPEVMERFAPFLPDTDE